MSTATATADAPAAAPGKGKKKMILITAAVALLLVVAFGVAAVLLLKKNADDGEDGAADQEVSAAVEAGQAGTRDLKHPPTFVPLDPFTVNLADKEADRYAQVGMTLELDDPATGDAIKAFMPAIRNNILMVLAHKTSAELLERDGKTELAQEIRREAARALGIEPVVQAPAGSRKKLPAEPVSMPVAAVYFSTFIIQ